MKRILVFAASLALVSCAFAQPSLGGGQPASIQPEVAPAAAPGITFVETIHDFGQIPVGKPVTFRYEFTNTGKADLIVSNAKPGCGCTTPTWTKTPVAPGEKGYVDATYNAAGVGPFNKSVTVENNAGTPIILYLKGEVKAAEQAVPLAAPAPLPAAVAETPAPAPVATPQPAKAAGVATAPAATPATPATPVKPAKPTKPAKPAKPAKTATQTAPVKPAKPGSSK